MPDVDDGDDDNDGIPDDQDGSEDHVKEASFDVDKTYGSPEADNDGAGRPDDVDTRDANDRGYECLLLEDCCAATKLENHLAAVDMIKMQGGVFGAVSTSEAFVEALP